MTERRHKNTSIEHLIDQMLHSQHKDSINQSDGTPVEEWRKELLYRINHLVEISKEAANVVYQDKEPSALIKLLDEHIRID